jgi:hypothetical protein
MARETFNFTGSRGTGFEVNERADSETKQSIKVGAGSQLLLPVADRIAQWKKEVKEVLHNFCQNTKRERWNRLL